MNKSHLSCLVVLVFIIGCTPKQNSSKQSPDIIKHAVEEKSDSINDIIDWQTYSSGGSGFSVRYPQEWKTDVFKIRNDQKIINIYPVSANDTLNFPLTIHENVGLSFISIFPNGYGTELPSGITSSIDKNGEIPVAFDINTRESLAFLLENNQSWGYFIIPSSPPASWKEHGFIFAQAAVNDFEIKCFDKESGKELKMSECNPLHGDSLKRYGKINQADWKAVKRILETIKFENKKNNEQAQSGESVNGITITKPQPGSVISSPLEISGRARGNWFFEAQIEIELLKNGNILSSTVGKAKSNWMTNDYVGFSASLIFPEVEETGNAILQFSNSNPSGKKELEKSYRVPVVIRE